jgi:energy-coupling factor transport system substrate-specific component
MSWQVASFLILAAVLIAGFAWYERSRPPSQVVALVAALAALAIAGRIAFAAFPNVKPTTDIVILSGFALGPAPGFAVGALTALVSNFWFGQGPWTPWQMAGWGLCGVLGAALSLRRREVGRLTLAIFCGAAGLAYGLLLNFSLMATYGGELSLQRFLALEARAIPFDLAHAAGNVVLALIAGPAMLRMLVRFRERFEWRLRTPALATAVLAMLALVSLLPGQAEAAGGDRAANWLVSVQNNDGGWGASPDQDSSAEITGWVMLGLEAAGRNPLDVQRGGRSPVDLVRRDVGELNSSGDLARTILALEGAGVSSRSFGGRDLVAALLKRRRSNGSYEGWPNSTAFAVIALRTAGATGSLDASIKWLSRVQNKDGGWGDTPGSPSTADGTGAVMQAMPGSKVAEQGLSFLRKVQRPNGGFPLGGSGSVNAQSTAWAVQGMIAVGADPARIKEGGNSALDYLASRQAGDGHYSYSSSSDQTPVWVTGQVLAAVEGEAFPIPAPPREPQSVLPKPGGGSAPLPGIPGSSPGSLAPLSPSTGGSTPGAGGGGGVGSVPPVGGLPSVPGVPAPPGGGGATPIPLPGATAAPPFEASEPPPGPKPWAPAGIGLGAGGLALGGVIFLGRRFGW